MHHTVTDQMNREVIVPVHPQRIISLVPSQTKLLFDLGLDEEIVGVTRFCIHPGNKVSEKTKVGGTKDFDIDKIKALNPDLIIGNKEENYEDGINELKKHYPVWMSDIYTLDDAYEMMDALGFITGKQNEAEVIIREIQSGFKNLSLVPRPSSLPSCSYFIWRKPYMVAASGTFIDHMLGVLGMRNVFGGLSRYPSVTTGDIAACRPDYIFLSSEPYSFTDRHKAEFRNICPDARIVIVNGLLFSWYGSHLRYTPAYFEDLRRMMMEDFEDQ